MQTERCFITCYFSPVFNPSSAKFIKWSNTPKQFVGKLPTNCLSVFDHFSGLALKGLSLFRFIKSSFKCFYFINSLFKRKSVLKLTQVSIKSAISLSVLSQMFQNKGGLTRKEWRKIAGWPFFIIMHERVKTYLWRLRKKCRQSWFLISSGIYIFRWLHFILSYILVIMEKTRQSTLRGPWILGQVPKRTRELLRGPNVLGRSQVSWRIQESHSTLVFERTQINQ